MCLSVRMCVVLNRTSTVRSLFEVEVFAPYIREREGGGLGFLISKNSWMSSATQNQLLTSVGGAAGGKAAQQLLRSPKRVQALVLALHLDIQECVQYTQVTYYCSEWVNVIILSFVWATSFFLKLFFSSLVTQTE